MLIVMSCVAAILCASASTKIFAQGTTPDIATIVQSLKFRRDAVTSLRAEYLMEYVVSPQQADYLQQANRKVYGDVPMPRYIEDYNRVAACRLVSKGEMWREDITEEYPGTTQAEPLQHFRAFDGERYYAYNDDGAMGLIAGDKEAIDAASHRFAAAMNGAHFLGLHFPLDTLEDLQKLGAIFKIVGQEQVLGQSCIKCIAVAHPQAEEHIRVTLWLVPNKNYISVKSKVEFATQDPRTRKWQGSAVVRTVTALEELSNGMFVNKVLQEDQFASKDSGALHWEQSIRFTLGNIQINKKYSQSMFTPEFPPGTLVEDRIMSPGRLEVVGPDFRGPRENMAKGEKLTPEGLEGTPVPQISDTP
jgi:hypothetical protein